MKSKMINPNTVSDMEVFNMKNQAKMVQTLQKLSKGRRKIEVNLSKSSQKYLDQVIDELKKQMADNTQKMPNVMDFLDYLKEKVHVEKRQKRPKIKKILLSFEEQDFLIMQIKATIKEVQKQRANLKWYNLIKKMAFSSFRQQNEILLNEILNKSESDKKKK